MYEFKATLLGRKFKCDHRAKIAIKLPDAYIMIPVCGKDVAHAVNIPVIADTTMIPFTHFNAASLGIDVEVVSSYAGNRRQCLGHSCRIALL